MSIIGVDGRVMYNGSPVPYAKIMVGGSKCVADSLGRFGALCSSNALPQAWSIYGRVGNNFVGAAGMSVFNTSPVHCGDVALNLVNSNFANSAFMAGCAAIGSPGGPTAGVRIGSQGANGVGGGAGGNNYLQVKDNGTGRIYQAAAAAAGPTAPGQYLSAIDLWSGSSMNITTKLFGYVGGVLTELASANAILTQGTVLDYGVITV